MFPYAEALGELEARCPDFVEPQRWRQCLLDARRFLAAWGDKAAALGWGTQQLLGLHTPPAKPHPTYSRLARYDYTGLLWLLQDRRVIALTDATAAIENPSGAITIYRKLNKPALSCPIKALWFTLQSAGGDRSSRLPDARCSRRRSGRQT